MQPSPGEPAQVAFQTFEFVPEIELPFESTFQDESMKILIWVVLLGPVPEPDMEG